MKADAYDAALLNIAPGRDPVSREIAARLRECGMWEPLCRHALWQIATNEGRPVHDESSAFWTILDHLGELDHGLGTESDQLLEVLGATLLTEALLLAGRRHLSMSSWAYWKRLLEMPPEPDDEESWRFADGWNERHGLLPINHDERQPGMIPETFEGENIAWGYDPVRGDVYSIPI